MSLAVIGGSNFLGRYLIRSLAANYNRVTLADPYPQRQSVYDLQEILGEKLRKNHLGFKLDLVRSLEGADEVWVVTHDYFKLALSKLFYLEKTAAIAKQLGIKKLKVIAPLELDQLNKADGKPDELIDASLKLARENFPNLSYIQTNLIFGDAALSLLFQYTIEQLKANRAIVTRNDGKAKFQPVHQSIVLEAVKSAKPGSHEVVAGPEILTWSSITKILAQHVCASEPSHGGYLNQIKSAIATNAFLGDALYPSQLVQFYHLLEQDRLPVPTVSAGPKLSESLQPSAYHAKEAKAWHRVIID